MSAEPRRLPMLRVFVSDPEAAVFGLVATTEAGAALLAQLEAQAASPIRPGDLTPEIAAKALARFGSKRGAALGLGVPRSTLRDALARWERAS